MLWSWGRERGWRWTFWRVMWEGWRWRFAVMNHVRAFCTGCENVLWMGKVREGNVGITNAQPPFV